MMSLTVLSPNERMPSSNSFSSGFFTSLTSSARVRSSTESSSVCEVTTLLTMLVVLTSNAVIGENSLTAALSGADAMAANLRLKLVAYSLGITSPKSRIRKVRMTVWTIKSSTELLKSKIWFIA